MSLLNLSRRRLGVAVVMFALVAPLLVPLPGSAQEEPVVVSEGDDVVLPDLDDVDLSTESAKDDPLGLTPFTDFIKVHSLGTDIVECGRVVSPPHRANW